MASDIDHFTASKVTDDGLSVRVFLFRLESPCHLLKPAICDRGKLRRLSVFQLGEHIAHHDFPGSSGRASRCVAHVQDILNRRGLHRLVKLLPRAPVSPLPSSLPAAYLPGKAGEPVTSDK